MIIIKYINMNIFVKNLVINSKIILLEKFETTIKAFLKHQASGTNNISAEIVIHDGEELHKSLQKYS